MAGEIEFSTNDSEPSTDGFQFEFRCVRCDNGYRTEFDTWSVSAAVNVLDGASGFLGGIVSEGTYAMTNAAPSRTGGRHRAVAPQVRRAARGERQILPSRDNDLEAT